ncbi:RmlC-like cupin domain-containing protein [Astrocystis sublimbata]|nr:RmlC-like cupin domain-containing protein [Astrocystis sublimbata]
MQKTTPLKELKVLRYQIPAYKLIPNTSIQHKPLLIYKNAFPNPTASGIERALCDAGAVTPQWRYTMYGTSHFHSTAHEVLGVAAGKATICFGHEDNPEKVVCELDKGDLAVVPAGVAHRLMEVRERGFEMVGAYPEGCAWDMCYGAPGEEGRVGGIARLKWFVRDPIYGGEGPVLDS